MGDSLKRRIVTLEDRVNDAITRWLHSLTDEELAALAPPPDPATQAFLESLSNEELEELAAGRWPSFACWQQYQLLLEMKR